MLCRTDRKVVTALITTVIPITTLTLPAVGGCWKRNFEEMVAPKILALLAWWTTSGVRPYRALS
jgi:hypothetical protein